MKEIDKVKAYCVINEVTMQQVSQFYRRKGDAVRWIAKNCTPWISSEHNATWCKYAVAEFAYNYQYYVIE
jgi:hypothetical protein